MKLLYFAYGSNMLLKRIEDRVGKVINAGAYVMKDWELNFDCGYHYMSFANIVRSKGQQVEGVLYEIDKFQESILDGYEFYPRNYVKHYWQLDKDTWVFAYVASPQYIIHNVLPVLSYINLLIDGAEENKLWRTYNQLVQFKINNYKIKKSKHKIKRNV